mgnify:CR=1 FL=1
MSLGTKIVELAAEHIGEAYKNVQIPMSDPNYHGPWDCAEFATWCVYQASQGAVILGYRPAEHEAYTGYWNEDALRLDLAISVEEAASTPGAMVLRVPTSKVGGHIAICVGDGIHTIEAHSTAAGVGRFRVATTENGGKRHWDKGIRIPDDGAFKASIAAVASTSAVHLVPSDKPVYHPLIEKVQSALTTLGYSNRGDGLFGPSLAGLIARFQTKNGLVSDARIGPETLAKIQTLSGMPMAVPATGTYNEKYHVYFTSLVPGGFYAADPDDLGIDRSVRTNNPGALNISSWQRTRAGYVGTTFPDSAGNVTTIYRTPEHGVAAWYHLISKRYGLSDFTLAQLAKRYAGGGASESRIADYVAGWSHGNGLAEATISVTDEGSMLVLAKAMFRHERRAGKPTPLSDEQILFGMKAEKDGSLPT